MDNLNIEQSNCSYIVWGVVIAGTVIGLSTEFMLNFLGIGLGLSTVEMSSGSLLKAGIGSIIWLIASSCLAMGLAGLIGVTCSNISCAKTRAIHGFLIWGLSTLLSIMIASAVAGSMLGGASNIIKTSLKNINPQYISTAVEYSKDISDAGNKTDKIEKTAQDAMDSTGKTSIAIFAVFLLSALSCMTGAYYGGSKQRYNNENTLV